MRGAGICGLLSLVTLQACTPDLNWRQVQLQNLKAHLPCKADTAARTVSLGHTPLTLQMMGCEADGALFAIGHIHTEGADAAANVLQQWQLFALQALRANVSQPAAWPGPAWATQVISLHADGRNPEGQPLQARLTWLRHGPDVYHLAVYAQTLNEDMTQPFLENLQAP